MRIEYLGHVTARRDFRLLSCAKSALIPSPRPRGAREPAFSLSLDPIEIKSIAIYIAERRVDQRFTDFRVEVAVEVPQDTLHNEAHGFRIEVVTTGLHAKPYSVAPLPDGSFIVTEKTQGLHLVSASGGVSEFTEGAPVGYDDGFNVYGLDLGIGHLMDVAVHPDYAENGWAYIHYGHRCKDCNAAARESTLPDSMNRMIRGRDWSDQHRSFRAAIYRR